MASIHALQVKDIDGGTVELGSYAGKVLLVVNVASACGYTPQYADLEKLHQQYRERGFAVLGFPSNDFGAQEPGSEADIKAFCSRKFRVTFPMFAKIAVKGPAKHPLYAALGAAAKAPKWNFHKYLVGKDGEVVAAYPSAVEPLSSELTAAIEAALAK